MLKPRSVAAHAPPLDREVILAIADRQGPWARSVAALERAAVEHYGRDHLHWVADPEESLCAGLRARLTDKGAALALPAWGRPSLGPAARRHFEKILWMDPQDGRLDPGEVEVKMALDQGAGAVLLAPVAGDCSSLQPASASCAEAGAVLGVDGRASVGSRTPEGGPGAYGDLALLPPDGEPGLGICPGALLATPGDGVNGVMAAEAPGTLETLGAAFAALAVSLRDEPRLRRLWSGPARAATGSPASPSLAPPSWSCAGAHARLQMAESRASQRGRHARSLREHCGNLPAVTLVGESRGYPAAGAAFPLLAQAADEIARLVRLDGLSTVPGLGGWLAPEAARTDTARRVAERALLLPLHPFFRPEDLRWMGEVIRRATLRVHGTGQGDPTSPAP